MIAGLMVGAAGLTGYLMSGPGVTLEGAAEIVAAVLLALLGTVALVVRLRATHRV